mmetsp:Transcript_21900/g.47633  ORF Transcript_21900/g.47633 Transcript_21900/m.47633 type:complete len:120 (+) Transcript_21900:595-954(+)
MSCAWRVKSHICRGVELGGSVKRWRGGRWRGCGSEVWKQDVCGPGEGVTVGRRDMTCMQLDGVERPWLSGGLLGASDGVLGWLTVCWVTVFVVVCIGVLCDQWFCVAHDVFEEKRCESA